MKYLRLQTTLVCLTTLLAAHAVQAQPAATVDIYLKSKKSAPIKDAVVVEESTKGIKLMGQGMPIPPDDIEDVDYSRRIPVVGIRVIYANGITEEKSASAAADRAKRDEHLDKAITKYKEALEKIDKSLTAPRRHAEFKIAYLTALLGIGSDKQIHRVDAVKKLNDFKKAHADGWQLTPALLMLIKLHAEQGNFDEVKAAIAELAKADVPARIKHETKLLGVRLLMDEGKALREKKQSTDAAARYADAEKELTALATELPKDSPLQLHVQLAQAQIKAVGKDAKQREEATKNLEKMLKDTSEKEVRAAVYNTLGELYLIDGRPHEARWQFLWVDVIYNQDKEEHARALYHLWRVFNQLNDPERGQDFLETLTTDARFAGTYYRDKALREAKGTQ